jgi:uncharacterized protein
MLGFSIQKLLFTVAVIVAIWYGFKWVGRMKEVRDREREKLRRQAGKEATGGASGDASGDAEEMMECPACGAFVAAQGAKSCGRDDCPYPG